jgi:hypothetical protein
MKKTTALTVTVLAIATFAGTSEETGYTVISSAELGEQWLWCFVDERQQNY